MSSQPPLPLTDNLHVAWARLLFSGFASAGIEDVVLSPGSRSTPLALAAAHSGLRVHVVLDERQAGFFALGQARATGRPSVVVCTSGTAAGHYLPSLLEAREAQLPMIVLTADRPWEAHHVHSSQTTDQIKLFGDAVRGFFALGVPDSHQLALAAVARTAAQSVALSLGPSAGGVHVNAPFRKPLEPRAGSPVPQLRCAPMQKLGVETGLDATGREHLASFLAGARRPLFLAGPALERATPATHEALREVLAHTCGVLIAEATSGLRAISGLAHGEVLLAAGALEPPDRIIQLGLPPVSTALQNWLADSAVPRLVVARSGWPDPWANAQLLMPLEIGAALATIRGAWPHAADPSWADSLRALDAALERAQLAAFEDGVLAARTQINEPAIARCLARVLDSNDTLMIGNSLPVRDLDVFGGALAATCVHQRGVAGIDGLLAGAVGTASVATGPVVLYVGDVSFLHDAGALALLTTVQTPLVIVVVNNDGGRIFHELPVAKDQTLARELNDLFLTPHGHSPAKIASGFGIAAHRVEQLEDLHRALGAARGAAHATVIEVVVESERGNHLRRAWRELAARVGGDTRGRAS